jgi:nascent polypeptide-associated complex subunit alpha
MPSVQEELAALRAKNLTKKNAESLKDAGPLSTPEAEESALNQTKAKNRVGAYSKEAQSNLEKGGKAVDQTLEFQMKAGQAKKSDVDKKKEAAKNLQSFNQAKLQAKTGGSAPAAAAATPAAATDDDDDDDDVPELEEPDDVPTLEEVPDMDAAGGLPPGLDPASLQAAAAGEPRTLNRAEKKARRTMEKLGMKKVPGITQCTLKMGGRQGVWQIKAPDVFEKNGAYIVFGEARQGGGMASGQQAMQAQQAMAAQRLAAETPAGGEKPPKIEEVDEEGAIDESGVEAKDIELVMGQAGCSRAKAVKALKESSGDLVNAIMSLTT